jgi:hypothetical protein
LDDSFHDLPLQQRISYNLGCLRTSLGIGEKGVPASADYADARQGEIISVAQVAQSVLDRRPLYLYGGSVNSDNCVDLLSRRNFDGRSAWNAARYLGYSFPLLEIAVNPMLHSASPISTYVDVAGRAAPMRYNAAQGNSRFFGPGSTGTAPASRLNGRRSDVWRLPPRLRTVANSARSSPTTWRNAFSEGGVGELFVVPSSSCCLSLILMLLAPSAAKQSRRTVEGVSQRAMT